VCEPELFEIDLRVGPALPDTQEFGLLLHFERVDVGLLEAILPEGVNEQSDLYDVRAVFGHFVVLATLNLQLLAVLRRHLKGDVRGDAVFDVLEVSAP